MALVLALLTVELVLFFLSIFLVLVSVYIELVLYVNAIYNTYEGSSTILQSCVSSPLSVLVDASFLL